MTTDEGSGAAGHCGCLLYFLGPAIWERELLWVEKFPSRSASGQGTAQLRMGNVNASIDILVPSNSRVSFQLTRTSRREAYVALARRRKWDALRQILLVPGGQVRI